MNGNLDFTWDEAYPSDLPRNEYMRITDTGNVGIGTASPEGLLQISRDSSTAYDGTNDSGQSNIGASLTIKTRTLPQTALPKLICK